MNILDKIVANKRREVAHRKQVISINQIEESIHDRQYLPSFSAFITEPSRSGVITEFKRMSPSKGIINDRVSVCDVVAAYEVGRASALSVLTDYEFFGGVAQDLTDARDCTTIPIIRKDFIVDEYQIVEARAIGASAILLIAACLTHDEIKQFARLARRLNLEVLFEVHNREEIDKYCDDIQVVGVNNRNLKTFEVSVQNSIDLLPHFPANVVKISESGLSDTDTMISLYKAGFDGFLIGENFMKTTNPGAAAIEFLGEYMHKRNALV